MPIKTSIARHYAIRLIVTAVACVVLGLWGAYDLWIKIPREETTAAQYDQLISARDELTTLADQRTLSIEQQDQYEQIESELQVIAPEGSIPERPSKLDRLTQWFFISCLLFAPYFFWKFAAVRRCRYELDDEGTLNTPEGSWPQSAIVDIDMDRWMAKSIATVELEDGTQLRLDDYMHRNLHLIVGQIAHRFYPDDWDEDAKQIKPETDDDGLDDDETIDDATDVPDEEAAEVR